MVLGGASSGKSSYAEKLVTGLGKSRVYVATAQAFDAEMRAKIEDHKRARGPDWRTIEAPLELPAALDTVPPDEVVLIDCLTLWLSNLILGEAPVATATDRLLAAIGTCTAPVVVVSNEVGAGIVPENALARRFRSAQGRLNQQVAAQAECVVTVMAGLPLALKGSLPE